MTAPAPTNTERCGGEVERPSMQDERNRIEAKNASLRRILFSDGLYETLMNVQNGIDSPASSEIANRCILAIDALRAAALSTRKGG